MPSKTVSGGVRSMLQLKLAGLGSTLPAASLARTSKVCGPAPRLVYVFGLAHALNPPPSIWHSKLRMPAGVTLSVPEKLKGALVLLVGLVGPLSTLVFGG